jgi:hypothetical protein
MCRYWHILETTMDANDEWFAFISESKMRTWMLEVGWDLPEGDPLDILINEEEQRDEQNS